jgi:hypothetical protein
MDGWRWWCGGDVTRDRERGRGEKKMIVEGRGIRERGGEGGLL